MTALAVSRTEQPPAAPEPVKPARISKRMKKVLSLLATKGMTQREAAKQCGMSETYLSTALRKPELQAFIARKSRETIALGVLRASNRVLELVDASSEHVSLDASKHILAIEGIRPPETGTNISIINNVSPGYVLDLREPVSSPLIQHQARTEGKSLNTNDVVQGDE